MVALARGRRRSQDGVVERILPPLPVAANAVIYEGALIGRNIDGFWEPWLNNHVQGCVAQCANGNVLDNTGGANGDVTVTGLLGIFPFANDPTSPVGPANFQCFAADDNSVSATGVTPVGATWGFDENDEVLVRLTGTGNL